MKLILWILRHIPYHTKFGLTLEDLAKYKYYAEIGHKKNRCLCGGRIRTFSCSPDGWITECTSCQLLIDED